MLSEVFFRMGPHRSSEDRKIQHLGMGEFPDKAVAIVGSEEAVVIGEMGGDLVHLGSLVEGSADKENILHRRYCINHNGTMLQECEGEVKTLLKSVTIF